MVPCCGWCRDRKLPTLRWLRRWIAGQPAIFCLSPLLRSLLECQKTHMEAFNLAGPPSASGGTPPPVSTRAQGKRSSLRLLSVVKDLHGNIDGPLVRWHYRQGQQRAKGWPAKGGLCSGL